MKSITGAFVDLSKLTFALRAYRSVTPPGDVLLAKGDALFRRFLSDLDAAADHVVTPLLSNNDATILRGKFQKADVATGDMERGSELYGEFLDVFYPWLQRNRDVIVTTFETREVLQVYLLTQVVKEVDVALKVQALAKMPSMSGNTAVTRWMSNVSQALGNRISDPEVLSSELEGVSAVAEDLRDAQRRALSELPGTPAAREADQDVVGAKAVMDAVVQASSNPVAATAVATIRLSDNGSKIAQRHGLTPEQEAVMRSNGHDIVIAGAGSGKTMTIVARCDYLVHELGYKPERICVCSFTRAASAELSLRLKERGRVYGASVGTTHSVARGIIQRNRPDLADRIRGSTQGLTDRLFVLAMKQVEYSMRDYNVMLRNNVNDLQFIESIPDWQKDEVLSEFHTAIRKGNPLNAKQRGLLRHKYTGNVRTAKKDDTIDYARRPAGQWFNLGIENAFVSESKARLEVENFINSRMSVAQAREKYSQEGQESPIVALYGAYEYLKKNYPGGVVIDFNDQLSMALNILETDPKARSREQARFDVIIVDEAQDLNDIQYALFNILGARSKILSYVGDDKQCVDVHSLVYTPKGPVPAGTLVVGDEVYSYRNGHVVPQVVRVARRIPESRGVRVTTYDGNHLLMTARHRTWVLPARGAYLVCLRHVEGSGYDLVITSDAPVQPHNIAPGAMTLTWVLGACPDEASARKAVAALSSVYDVQVGSYSLIGGDSVMGDYSLSKSYPSWSEGPTNVVVRSHGLAGTEVLVDGVLQGHAYDDYREALSAAHRLSAVVFHELVVGDKVLAEVSARLIHVGASMVVTHGDGVRLDEVTSAVDAFGNFIDLDVDDASNFFAGGILTHNSIYGFRGSNAHHIMNQAKRPGVTSRQLTMNFRSGSRIVEAANTLIKHNESQIPMVCKADPNRGEGGVVARVYEDHQAAAKSVAMDIAERVKEGESPSDFGIIVRNNEEANSYTLSLAARGIPYRMLKSGSSTYFQKPIVRSILMWMRLAIGGTEGEINDAFVSAPRNLNFGLGDDFEAQLLKVNTKGVSYYDYALQNPIFPTTGRSAFRNERYVKPYLDEIQRLRASGTSSSESLIPAILDVRTMSGTIMDILRMNVTDEDLKSIPEDLEDRVGTAAVSAIQPLMHMADNIADPAKLLSIVNKINAANERVLKNSPNNEEDWKISAVTIGTGHGWKGLQTKVVYGSASEGVFPSNHAVKEDQRRRKINPKDGSALEEERRLFYVVLTRAQESFIAICPQKNYLGINSAPSRFVSEACIPIVGLSKDEQVSKTASSWAFDMVASLRNFRDV